MAPSRPHPMTGPLLMLAAAILFTVMSAMVKLMPPQYNIWHLAFIRCFGGLLVMLVISERGKNPFAGKRKPLLIARGLSGSLAFACVVSGMRILPMSTAIVMFYAYPVFAAFFGILFYREKISLYQLGCMAALVFGVGILFDFSLTGSTFGQVMVLIGAVFSGITVTLIQGLRSHNGPRVIFTYFCAMGSLLSAPMALSHPIIPATSMEWGMILLMVFSSVGAQLLMNQGFFYCKGFEGAAYMSMETVFAALVGILFMGDPVTFKFFAGGSIIVASGLALNAYRQRHPS